MVFCVCMWMIFATEGMNPFFFFLFFFFFFFFKETIGKLREKLKVGEQESKRFKYIGVMVEQKEDSICVNQWGYINSIREPEARRFTGNREEGADRV